ncbi:MAG: chemotaxis protein CheX [Aureliella sp.]
MLQSATDQIESEVHRHLVSSNHVVLMMQDLFQSLLDQELNSISATPPVTSSWIRAKIEITGQHSCFVQVSADREMSYRIASSMFCMEPEEIAIEEVGDALCEVANVIGGNIKGVINRDCGLSLPCIDNREPIVKDGSIVCNFENNEHYLKVIVV